MTTFDSLPQEIVDLITDNLDKHRDILNLSSTWKSARQQVAPRAFEHLRFTTDDKSSASAILAAKTYGNYVKSISWVAKLPYGYDPYWDGKETWDILSGKLTPQATKISVEFDCKYYNCKKTRSMAPYSGLKCWVLDKDHKAEAWEKNGTISWTWLRLAHKVWNVLASNPEIRSLHIGKLLMEFCCHYDSTYHPSAGHRYGDLFPLNALLQRLDSFSLDYYFQAGSHDDVGFLKPCLRDILLNRVTKTTSLTLSQLRTTPEVPDPGEPDLIQLIQDPTPSVGVMLPALTSPRLNKIMIQPVLLDFLAAHRHQLLDLEMIECYSYLSSIGGPQRATELFWYQIFDAISGYGRSNARCALRRFVCGPANIYRWERLQLPDPKYDVTVRECRDNLMQAATKKHRRVFDYTVGRWGAAMAANHFAMKRSLHRGRDQESYDALMQIVKNNAAKSA